MKYKPIIWIFMTGRMKKGLKEIWPETNALLKKAKPIYKDLLKKVEGVSDKNPMSSNITMSFVIISIWLASERKITPEQMSQVMESALDWKVIRAYFGTIDMNTEKGIKRFGNITLPIAPSQISVRSIAIRRSILCSAISTISR